MKNDQPLSDPLYDLIQHVRHVFADEFPDIYGLLVEYRQLCSDAEERNERGSFTDKATRARAKLRHPLGFEELPQKTRSKIVLQREKHRKQLLDTFGNALKRYAIFKEYDAKLIEMDRASSQGMPIDKSRQSHDPESLFALGQPFIEKLARAKASPSAMGRLPEVMVECIADLIQAHAKDPHGEDPNNPWNLMVEAGVLEAPARHLDLEQRSVINHAHRLRSEHQKNFIAEARQVLGLPEGFSEAFLAGAARIADLTRELSRGESEAFYKCHALQREQDIAMLAQLLNLDPERDYGRVAAVADFVRNADDFNDDQFASRVRRLTIAAYVDGIEPHKKLKRDWVNELIDGLPELLEKLSGSADSIDAFNRLFRDGLDASASKEGFKEREERREAEKYHSWYQEHLCQALVVGKPFKIEYPFVHSQGSDDFERTDGEVWSCDAWIAAHGYPEGCEPAEDGSGDFEVLDPDEYEVTYFGADWLGPDEQVALESDICPATEPRVEYAEFDEIDPVGAAAEDPEIDNEEIDFEALIRDDDEVGSVVASAPAAPDNPKANHESVPRFRRDSNSAQGNRQASEKALTPAPAEQTRAGPTRQQDYRSPYIEGELPRDGDAQPSLFNINDEDM